MSLRLWCAVLAAAVLVAAGCSGPDAPKKKGGLKTHVPAPATTAVL